MTKKKQSPKLTVTIEEWDQFVRLFTKVKDIAFLYTTVIRSREDRLYSYFYPHYLEGPDPSGIYISEDGENATSEFVPLEFILDPDPHLEKAEKIIAEKTREYEQQRCNSEFHQYLRLKEKFKDAEEPPC